MATKEERQKIRNDHPDSWIAVDEGDSISGEVVDVTEAWSDQRQNGSWYPLLTISLQHAQASATGYATGHGELKVHAFGAVLYNEVMRHRPEVGERVTIVYRGTGEAKKRGQNPPELYSLRVHGRTDQAQRAYSRIEGPGQAPPPGQPAAHTGDGGGMPPAEVGEDIPF